MDCLVTFKNPVMTLGGRTIDRFMELRRIAFFKRHFPHVIPVTGVFDKHRFALDKLW